MNPYLVSIITPLYNSERFIGKTFESVINQTYTNWEWIIIDDKSTDNSLKVIMDLARDDNRIRIMRNEGHLGSGKTRNRAINVAAGSIISFLDSDDTWHVEKLERHVDFMHKTSAVFSHTSYGYIDEAGNRIKGTLRVSPNPVSYNNLLKRTEISCLTAMYNAKLIGKFFMSEHMRKQDYALWLAILKAGHKSYGLDEELAYYRLRSGSATNVKSKLIFSHFVFLKSTQNMNAIQALYYTSYWMINGVIRYYLRQYGIRDNA